ncbi:hypothetical protein ACFVWN_01510 [Nocardiopsis flavescens]|uniref:Uncharacterized protein n=1 Tax=Nocardiopsis flavescens TaxID=758803 RepID=A0A1M6GL92_9ACTN|nr:hypothetical protein [Nocardiopsis flavescens]SHJ10683.1 hypothetical protein SAMN05421803_103451 [Nocardiopsis flavescens]
MPKSLMAATALIVLHILACALGLALACLLILMVADHGREVTAAHWTSAGVPLAVIVLLATGLVRVLRRHRDGRVLIVAAEVLLGVLLFPELLATLHPLGGIFLLSAAVMVALAFSPGTSAWLSPRRD